MTEPAIADTVAATRAAATSARGQRDVRADIQALRALAVLAVLVFHLWPNLLPGGYIGVDVFFVISGYLITSHLLREAVGTGRIRVAAFWSKRAKRLLPAALLTLAFTVVGILVWIPRSLWTGFLQEVIASAVYGENWLLSYKSVNYLASALPPSPVQNFWTLSVEEQFYVALPLLLIASLVVSRSFHWPRATTLLVAVAVCTAGSFAYSLWLTTRTGSLAYFPTTTRAWEFGAGALLSFVAIRAPRIARLTLPIIGTVAVEVGSLVFDAFTPFPGAAALVPVTATVLAIWAGQGSIGSRVGHFAPVAFLGRASYSIYLWHWPLIVLIPYATGHELTDVEKLGIIAITLFVSWASMRFVEDPIRFSPRLLGQVRPMTILIAMGSAMLLVVGLCSVPLVANAVDISAERANTAAIVASDPACLGAAAVDPATAPCSNPDLAGVLVPFPVDRGSDDDNRPGCWTEMGKSSLNVCSLGPTAGYVRHLIAVGDSHNNTLLGTYERMANDNNWRIDVAGRGGCYWTTADTLRPRWDQDACKQWQDALASLLLTGPFDAILTTHSDTNNAVRPPVGVSKEQATIDGLIGAWTPVAERGIPVISIRDNPLSSPESGYCVERMGANAAGACDQPRERALAAFDGAVQAAAATPGATVIDLSDLYCTATTCPAVIGNVVVYRDTTHVTATWARTLAPIIGRAIESVLSSG
ncbi:acyltransferase family protein [Glaciibacter superstes]|uniref:acyltransferase family protein n=1 Tax=Glaciibacter superstes TaxID=501023 RepID=UPI0003B5DECD|nr:acyltransferase family protein [Glaciibacter superstes]